MAASQILDRVAEEEKRSIASCLTERLALDKKYPSGGSSIVDGSSIETLNDIYIPLVPLACMMITLDKLMGDSALPKGIARDDERFDYFTSVVTKRTMDKLYWVMTTAPTRWETGRTGLQVTLVRRFLFGCARETKLAKILEMYESCAKTKMMTEPVEVKIHSVEAGGVEWSRDANPDVTVGDFVDCSPDHMAPCMNVTMRLSGSWGQVFLG